MTFSRIVLSHKLHQHFKKNAYDILVDEGMSCSLVETGLVVLENKSSMYFHFEAIIALLQS